jgi:hypothetical protein
MIFGIHTKAPSLSDMYDLNVAAWLGSSSVYPVRYEDLVRHVRDLESDEAEPYFTKKRKSARFIAVLAKVLDDLERSLFSRALAEQLLGFVQARIASDIQGNAAHVSAYS